MNALFILDPCMHGNILDVPALYPLVLVRFTSQDDPENVSPDLAKVNKAWYTFRYYGCFLSPGGVITQTNNTIVFVEI